MQPIAVIRFSVFGGVFRFDEDEAILGTVLFILKAILFLIFYFVFSRLEEWLHKRFAHVEMPLSPPITRATVVTFSELG